MLAVDTHIIVRYLITDHPEQSPAVHRPVDGQDVRVPTTVVLETAWVLRSAYGYGPAEIVDALRKFAALPTVSLENPALIAQALDWCEGGMDFADALHLASSSGCEALVTFDTAFAKMSRRLGAHKVRTP